MEFLNPAAGCLLVLAVPIVLFHLLKVRRQQEITATLLFWQEILDEQRFRTFGRRFRYPLSMLAGLLFLFLLTAAALHPSVRPPENVSQTVLLVDNSASMNAVEPSEKRTRLELVKRRILRSLAESPPDAEHRIALMTASSEPRTVTGFTDHLATLRRKVREIPPTGSVTELAQAVELARRLLAGEPHSKILVYTDGNAAEIPQFLGSEEVRFLPVGRPQNNIALTRFQPRRSPGDTAEYETLFETVNFGTSQAECRLEIERDGRLIDVIPLELAPGESHTQILRSVSEQGGMLKAVLVSSDPLSSDALAADNIAFAAFPDVPVQKILFFGEENFFLEHVLRSQPNIALTRLEQCPEAIPDGAVLVIHRRVPPVIPPGHVFVIDPREDSDYCRIGEPLEVPLVTNERKESPLMRNVSFRNLRIFGMRTLIPQVSASGKPTVLASASEENPVFLEWTSPGRHVLFLSAELDRGDFALRTAFPILISNGLNRFRESHEEGPVPPRLVDPRESNLRAVPDSFGAIPADETARPRTFGYPLRLWLILAAIALSATEW
ncbi:MAG: VWA domain-containing protein, partial [Planctomycetaceae bacterium]|nr:VWA domain-containing protein [Planctomycetaceae bacterium]